MTTKSSWRLRRSHGLFLFAGVTLVVVLHYFGFPIPTASETSRKPVHPVAHPVASNRWGQLEVVPIMLERPLEYYAAEPNPPPKITWFFEHQTPRQLLDFFMTCGLSDQQMSRLADTNRWRIMPQGILLEPDLELVRELEPAARERLYGILAESMANPAQRYPYCFRGNIQDWFAQCGLSDDEVTMVEKMTYQHNGVHCFSDHLYLSHTLAPEIRLKVARTLDRVPSLLVNLRITPDSDLNQLLGYWGLSSRLRNVKPLLESVKRTPEGSSINVAWFFPPVPRLLLYSYPHPTNTVANGRPPDCFWSCFNFFNEVADPRLTETSVQFQVMHAEYHRVHQAELFGDLILLYEPLGPTDIKTVHLCVFIADDIVFTKNGYDARHPWVLMRLDDMMIHYSPEKPLSKMILRRNKR